MSTVDQKLSESNSQVFASMDHARSQSVDRPSSKGAVPALIAYSIALPSAIAMVISAYLAYATFTMSEVAGCGSGNIFDCGHVLHSKWSKAAGVPVSVFAIMTHLTLISGLFVTLSQRSSTVVRTTAARVVFVAAIATALAALYFISLQVFVLDHLCSYCMGAHACGLLIGALAIWKLPVAAVMKKKLAGVALAGIAVLACIQIASAEPPTYKIKTFAPAVDTKSNSMEDSVEGSQIESSDVFSAPGGSEASEDSDIFSAPVDDGASFWRPRQNSLSLPARSFALLQLMSGGGLAVPSHSLLIASPVQQASGSETKVDNPDAASQSPVESARLVPMIGGSIKLKATDWPLIGAPDAKHIFVEMFDYTCEHCRETNAAIKTAKKKLGADLAILTLPVPMNQSCNPTIKKTLPAHAESCELSRLAIAVWRLDSEKFAEFHCWMFEGTTAPVYSNALAKAQELVGSERLTNELAKTVCSQYVDRNVELYKRVGGGAIPKMIFERTTIVGQFTSGESLTDLIKEYTAAK